MAMKRRYHARPNTAKLVVLLLLLISIPLFVLYILELGPLKPKASTFIVKDEKITDVSSSLSHRNRIVAYDDLMGLVYFAGGSAHLYVRHGSGGQSIKLPGITTTRDLYNAEYAFTSRSEFWIFSGTGGFRFDDAGRAKLRQYRLSGGNLPTTATLVSERVVGDNTTGAASFVKLKSGGLLGAYYVRQKPDPYLGAQDNYTDIGVIYRNPNGAISTQFPITRLDGFLDASTVTDNGDVTFALAQHPADGRIWLFSHADSFNRVNATRFLETSGNVSVDWQNKDYIGKPDAINQNNGELPYLAITTDDSNIYLAYQNAQQKTFKTSPFVKGAYVSIAKINQNGDKTFINHNEYVERVNQLALSVKNSEIYLAYHPIDTVNLTWAPDYKVASYKNGAWTQAISLGQKMNARIGTSGREPLFVLTLQDSRLHLLTLVQEAVVSGSSTPTPTPIVDTDSDGCTDNKEIGPDPALGGARDPNNPWDFYDIPQPFGQPGAVKDKMITDEDMQTVLKYVGTAAGKGANAKGVKYDDDLNQNGVKDGEELDRTPSKDPGKPWLSGPPNRAISLQDVGVMRNQIGHNCQ